MVFATSVQILYADPQDFWLELDDNRRFNSVRLGVKEFIQIDARLNLSTARLNTLIENASALGHSAELSLQELLAELRVLLNQTKQSFTELERGLIRLHVVNRTTRKDVEMFFVGQGGLVDTSFNRDIVVLHLADLVEMVVAHVTDQQQTVANVRDTTPDSVLREHLTKLALETTVRNDASWSVTHLLGWLSQHIPPIS